MKKVIMLTVAAAVIQVFALTPQTTANASGLEQALAQVLSASQDMARVQQIIQLKNDYETGNKNAVIETLVRTALDQTGNGSLAPVAVGNITQAAQTVLRQQVETRISDRIVPYYDQLNQLASLINTGGVLQPKASVNNNSLTGAPDNYRKVIQMTATAYAPGAADNGQWGNSTHVGTTVKKGIAAVDPNVIPLGSRLWVEGYGEAVAEDTGSAIKGNRIDLAFNSRSEAQDYGIKDVKVYLLK